MNTRFLLFTLFITFISFSLAKAQENPGTVVNTVNDIVDPNDNLISLREAVSYAPSGGVITFDPTVFPGDITTEIILDATIVIPSNKNLSIQGAVLSNGYPSITIKAPVTAQEAIDNQTTASTFRIFTISGGTFVFSNLTMSGGDISSFGDNNNGRGGTIRIASGNVTLQNVFITRSKAAKGGGIWCDGSGTLIIEGNSLFDLNYATADGGAIYNSSGTVTGKDVSFTNNNSINEGGAIYNAYSAKTIITNGFFRSNKAIADGGAIHNGNGSSCEVWNSTFINNSSNLSGGAIHNANQCKQLIVNSTFTHNSTLVRGGVTNTNDGGAVFNTNDGDMKIINSTFANNTTLNRGGAVFNASTLNMYIYNSVLVGNSADEGNNLFSGKTYNQQPSQTYLIGSVYGDANDTLSLAGNINNTIGSALNVFANTDPDLEIPTNTIKIAGSGAAAYGGTLMGKAGTDYFFHDGSIWRSLTSSNTYTFDGASPDMYGLTGDTVYVMGQNQISRTQVSSVYNAGAYALNPETPSAVVTSNIDIVNPFDQLISLREAVQAYTGLTYNYNGGGTVGVDITFDNTYFTAATANDIIVLQAELFVNKAITITGLQNQNGNLITVKVPVTYAEATANGTTASDYRVINSSFDTTISNLNLQGGDISGNAPGNNGGVIIYNPSATNNNLINVSISGAKAELGGGIYATNNATTLKNVLITNNTATSGGGVYNNGTATTTYTNTTIAENVATNGGGIYNAGTSTSTIQNSIIYSNGSSATTNVDESTVSNSLIENFTVDSVNQNIDGKTNPLFVDQSAGDFHLMACSPLINKGNNSFVTGLQTDLGNQQRIFDTTVDLGVYELQSAPVLPTASISVADSVISVLDSTTVDISFSSSGPWNFIYREGVKLDTVYNFQGNKYSFTFKPTHTGPYYFTLLWIEEDGKCASSNLNDSVLVRVVRSTTEDIPTMQWSVSTTGSSDASYTDVIDHTSTNVQKGTNVYIGMRPLVNDSVNYDAWKIVYATSPVRYYSEMTSAPKGQSFKFNNGNPLQAVGEYAFSVTKVYLFFEGDTIGEYTYNNPVYQHSVKISEEDPNGGGTDPGNGGTEPGEEEGNIPKAAIVIKTIADICDKETEYRIPFDLLYKSGAIQYTIVYSDTAINAGFSNITESKLLTGNYISVPIKAGIPSGHYHGTVHLSYTGTPNLLTLYPFVVDIADSLIITEQPKSVVNKCGGDGFILSVKTNSSTATYQWYLNDQPISGATSSTYQAPLTKENEGSYYVVATSSCGSAQSNTVQVEGSGLPIHIKWNDVLFVMNTENEYVSFQWYLNDLPIEKYGTSVYYTNEEGLYGTYKVRAYRQDGSYDESCPITFDEVVSLSKTKVYPTIVQRSSSVTVEISSNEDAENAMIEVYSILGGIIYKQQAIGAYNQIWMNMPAGYYIVRTILATGRTTTQKIIVK